MAGEEIILYKTPRKNTSPTVIDGQVFCTAEQREELYVICERLAKTANEITKLARTAAMDFYKIGEWLFARILEQPRGCNAKKLCASLPEELHISYDTICKALKIYKQFSNNPELIKDLSAKEVLGCISSKKPGAKAQVIEHYKKDEENQLEFDEDEFFSLPTLSGIELQGSRFATQGNELYIIRKGFNRAEPIAVMHTFVPEDAEMQTAYNQMMAGIQRATETYFAFAEKHGVIV